MKKVLNITLIISFAITILVPITGIHLHKLAATIFLLLSIIHTVVYREKLSTKRWFLLILIIISFISGIFGMILEQFVWILNVHCMSSILLIFFLAIHIFIFYKNFFRKKWYLIIEPLYYNITNKGGDESHG